MATPVGGNREHIGCKPLIPAIAVGLIDDFYTRSAIADDEIGLWRLMIDQRFQSKGFGRRALDLVCDHAPRRGSARKLISSCVAGPDGPERFYLRYGFRPTGVLRNGGRDAEIVLPLATDY